MPVFEWTAERDEILRTMRINGKSAEAIADRVGCSAVTVGKRILALGLPKILTPFWTVDNDEKLRGLWVQLPKLTLVEIAAKFTPPPSKTTISQRAKFLGLKSRHKLIGTRPPVDPAKDGELRSPFPGEDAVSGAEKPRPRERVYQRFQRCPWYHPLADGDCDVMVDRAPRPDGTVPPQYCDKHQPRIAPIPRGPLGRGGIAMDSSGGRISMRTGA